MDGIGPVIGEKTASQF